MTGESALTATPRALGAALGGRLLVDDVYAAGAKVYDALVGDDASEIEQLLTAARRLRGDVLDLGCGSGRLTIPFLASGRAVVAVDASEAMCELLEEKAAALPRRLSSRLEVVLGDMSRLDLGDRRFDVVLLGTTNVTLLTEDQRRSTFATIRRLLTPEGRLLVSTLDPGSAELEGERVSGVKLHGDCLVTVFEEVDRERLVRRVNVLAQPLDGAPPRVFTTCPRLVAEADVVADLRAAALSVVERVSFAARPHGGTVLVCESTRPRAPRSPLWEFLAPPSAFGDRSRTAVSARGIRIRFADGSERLCGTSGLWNVGFGYGRPEIAQAVTHALEDASYLTLFRAAHEPALRAARRLLDACGADRFGRVLFSTSGSAANDAVLKLVRQWGRLRGEPRRQIVVGLRGSYHGLTYGSFSLTGEDLGQDLYAVDRRLVRHVDPESPEELRALCEREGEQVCALVLEPLLGSGARVVPEGFVAEATRLAERFGFLLVADEVATGFYRVGPLAASCTAWPRKPDVLVLSKGLTNGTCAASAVLVAHEVCDLFDRFDATFVHGETQAGTPPTAAAIVATLDVAAALDADAACARVARWLDRELCSLVSASDGRLAATGAGCFRGITVLDSEGTPLAPSGVAALVAAIARRGAVVQPGPGGIQLVPALVYEEDDVEELVGAVAAGIEALSPLPAATAGAT